MSDDSQVKEKEITLPETPSEEQILEFNRQMREVVRSLKRSLKRLSKSEIIAVCVDQALREQEMRGIAKQLFEENKELKGKLDEKEEK